MVYSFNGLRKFGGVSLRSEKIIEYSGKISVIYELSGEGQQRLKWLDFYYAHNKNARLTCRRFGISTRTFYKAKNRYEKHSYKGLNDLSKRPHNFRKSKIPLEVISEIIKVREKHPTWSKYKIGACLRRRTTKISDSSVGRVLKVKGKIDCNISRKKQRIFKRSNKKLRIQKEIFMLKKPGDLVQMDIKHFTYPWGQTVYQFTAVDCVTKLRVLRLYTSRTARNGKEFLQEVIRLLPFKIKRLQSDNGSEFLGDFRKGCAKAKIIHLFSYPRSPEQNAFVEASHNTDEREFYSVKEMPMEIEEFRKLLKEWEHCYNYERPHQSLNYMTPWEYYKTICSNN